MLVGEDFLGLLGFARGEERDWFRLLSSVQGVGAKVALAILSALEVAELQRALASGDSAMIARANGVGPKLAQRITHELKDKAGALGGIAGGSRSEEHTSELQSLMRISYAVFCLKKKKQCVRDQRTQ